MDLATITGIIVGTLLIGLAAIMDGSLGMLVSVPALVIVFGGVMAGTLIRYRTHEAQNVFTLFKKCLVNEREDLRQIIAQLGNMASISRKEGILALERVKSDNPYLQVAINHCVDGADPDFLSDILDKEIDYLTERHEKGIRMLEVMGEMSLAFGMLATVVGVIQVLANMSDPGALGPAISTALLGTFYGALLAYLFFLPMGAKLRLYHEDEHIVRSVIRDGILGIQRGVNPRLLQEALKAALPPDKRKAV